MPSDRDSVLVEHRTVDPCHHLLTFEHAEVASSARAGQFVMARAGAIDGPPMRRPFSIMDADPNRNVFRLLIKVVGAQTAELSRLPIGAAVRCLGPLGLPFRPPQDGVKPYLVAGGFGIAPFRLLCRELKRAGFDPLVFYGGRRSQDLVLRDAIEELGVSLTLATEDGSMGFHGRVTAALELALDANPPRQALYACGPNPMLRAVAQIAAQRGIPAQVSLDPWMGCGMGACLGCVVRTQKAGEERPRYRCACTEGPVMNAADVIWSEETVSRARAEEFRP